jgi:hypothetical protein
MHGNLDFVSVDWSVSKGRLGGFTLNSVGEVPVFPGFVCTGVPSVTKRNRIV